MLYDSWLAAREAEQDGPSWPYCWKCFARIAYNNENGLCPKYRKVVRLTPVPTDAAALLAVDGRVGFQIGRCKGGTAEPNYEVDIYEQ